MFLEKLEAQGFKSFAQKNVLIFPGFLGENKRGITAIVGPNGSGKSNVADAVRWALGEQSMKTLRGKKSEDIIFSGTEKRGKLSMAEVSLFLNNADGVRKGAEPVEMVEEMVEEPSLAEASDGKPRESGDGKNSKDAKKKKEFNLSPLDFSEIVITRRIYRNGESEYLLNNQRVRLADIQMFLAKAKFGQKTYSVIGQGTVEGFLNSSMAERKEFFDEATGVKQFQIKRDESLNKLRSSYENLIQAQMLITEIEPRLRSLTRQVNRLNKREELEKELKTLQLDYFSCLWHGINSKFKKHNQEFLTLEQDKREKEKKLAKLSGQMEDLEKDENDSGEYDEAQGKIRDLQQKKNDLNAQIARLEAQMEVNLESRGKFDLAFLLNKKEELRAEQPKIKEEIASLKQNLEASQNNRIKLDNEREELNHEIEALNQKIRDFSQLASSDEEEEEEYQLELGKILKKVQQAKSFEDIKELKKVLDEIEIELSKVLEEKSKEDKKDNSEINKEWDELHAKLQAVTNKKEEANLRLNENSLRISARSERIKLLEERLEEIDREAKKIETKISDNSEEIDLGDLEEKKKAFLKELEGIEGEMRKHNEKVQAFKEQVDAKQSKFFAVQKELQAMQNEVNLVNNQLNEIKISATRYETKLEDLEVEIREDFGDLKAVKDHKTEEEYDVKASKEKITQNKRQLELIGGIDPQVETEYTDTKERFDFLQGQVNDFSEAVTALRKIIKELDLTIREQFDKEFKVIAKKFEEYFKILFNGGSAKIIKVMDQPKEEEGKEKDEKMSAEEMQIADLKKIKFLQKHNATGLAGVEIQATPPGKKIQSIAMLSGGERALTAIALICAIISANPSPFVVLDEVDAALDEANSERLAKILDELSHKTQFIVITHNRASMRRANILYGVTMGDDGVSKLLSVKLDEATATASR